MRHLFLILLSVFMFSSCGKDDSWSPEDDVKDYLAANPYGVMFENGTDGDLFVKTEGKAEYVSGNYLIIIHKGEISDTYQFSNPGIIITYSGEGTRWSEHTKYIELEKDKVTHVTITYPWTD